jgi:hypothetical protein
LTKDLPERTFYASNQSISIAGFPVMAKSDESKIKQVHAHHGHLDDIVEIKHSFLTKVKFVEHYAKALAVFCSDGRFTDQVEGLLITKGYASHDTITLPGGPALFDNNSGSHAMTESVRHAAAFLIKHHKIEHIILIAHQDCGYYKNRFPEFSKDKIEKQQHDDIRTAAQLLFEISREVLIEGYFAFKKDDTILFESISLKR